MHDDYLWDLTGSDPELEALERTLAPLRYEPEPLRVGPAGPRQLVASRWPWVLPAFGAAAAAALVLGLARDPRPVSVVVSVVPAVEAPEPVGSSAQEPETPEPPTQHEEQRDAEPTDAARPEPEQPRRTRAKAERVDPEGDESDEDAPRVDCILDPTKCEGEPDLPMRLSSSQIRDGVRPVKAKAQACGETHGAEPGTQVKVKLTIAGDTGRVRSARAQGAWSDTPMGRCVAGALSKARFGRFRKKQMGVLYPIFVDRVDQAPNVTCIIGMGNCGDPSLPKTLSSAEVRKGIEPVKAAAAACGAEHGAEPGTRVKVKLSVAGKTGRVTSASALHPWREEPLGICVAKALSKARFGRFRKERLGVVYPITVEAGS